MCSTYYSSVLKLLLLLLLKCFLFDDISGQFGCVYEGKLSRGPRSSNDYGSLTHEHVAIKTIKGRSTVLLRNISSYYVNKFSDSGMNILFYNTYLE